MSKKKTSEGPANPLRQERGVWVYQGERTDASIVDLIDRQREARIALHTRPCPLSKRS